MAELTDAQWAAEVADVVADLIAGTITEEQASARLATATENWPTRTLSNADLAARVSRFLARLNGLILTNGPPGSSMGELNTFAYDTANGALYGPKTASGWGTPVSLVGPSGPSPTLAVGTVAAGAAGSSPVITMTGPALARVLNFTIPAGATGNTGATPNLAIGTVTTGTAGSSASATITGTAAAPILSLTIPRGNTGNTGADATITDVTVTTGAAGSSASVVVGGTPGARTLAFTLPRGDVGATPNLTIGTVSEGTAAATLTGTATNPVLNLTIPKGNTGATPALSIGTVTTGTAGSNAVVTITGTAAAPVLNFTIPRGASGAGTGDMLAANNLSDLPDKAIARTNLSVWSRAEVGPVDTNYAAIIDSADAADLSFASTGINFAKDTGRLDYVDAASSAAVPGLTYTRTGAATAWRKDGTLVEFAPNVIRRTDAGVTIEGQRTNALRNSYFASDLTGFSIDAYGGGGSGGVTEVVADPTSVIGGKVLRFAKGSNGGYNLYQAVGYGAGRVLVRARRVSPTGSLQFWKGGGAATSETTFSPADNGWAWWSCPINPISDNGNLVFSPSPNAEFLIDAIQFEAGAAESSSYIPTTGAAATRGADNLSLVLPAGVTAYRAEYNSGQVAQDVASAGAFDLATGRPWLNRTLQKVTFS